MPTKPPKNSSLFFPQAICILAPTQSLTSEEKSALGSNFYTAHKLPACHSESLAASSLCEEAFSWLLFLFACLYHLQRKKGETEAKGQMGKSQIYRLSKCNKMKNN